MNDGSLIPWLSAAPEEPQLRSDYFVRLITLLSLKVDAQTMLEVVEKALPRGRK